MAVDAVVGRRTVDGTASLGRWGLVEGTVTTAAVTVTGLEANNEKQQSVCCKQ